MTMGYRNQLEAWQARRAAIEARMHHLQKRWLELGCIQAEHAVLTRELAAIDERLRCWRNLPDPPRPLRTEPLPIAPTPLLIRWAAWLQRHRDLLVAGLTGAAVGIAGVALALLIARAAPSEPAHAPDEVVARDRGP